MSHYESPTYNTDLNTEILGKLDFGCFTDLHKNILLYKANNFMYYMLLTIIMSSRIGVLSLSISTMLQIGPSNQPDNFHPVKRPTANHTEYLPFLGLL